MKYFRHEIFAIYGISACSGSDQDTAVGCKRVSRASQVPFLHKSTIQKRTHNCQVGGCRATDAPGLVLPSSNEQGV